jgi:tetratricopeptide (TPR) repeat protein
MQQRLQDNFVLNQLVASFEAQEEGLRTFFEDKELLQIIEFYEDEFEYEKALEVAQIGLTQYNFNSDFYISKARVLALMEEYDGVIETIQEGLSIAPNEIELKLFGIHAKIEMGKIEDAKIEIKKLLAEASGDDRVDLLICKAHIHEKEKDFEAMFNALKKALIIDSNEIKALEKIWIAVELCKNYKESVLLHKYVIDRNPYNHQAWYNLGHAYACLGEYPESIMSLEYSFLIEPSFEIGYKDCAEMCFQVGRFRQALSIHLDALKEFGADMELLVSIGRCYLELNTPGEAKRYLAKATKIDPYDDEAHYYLGKSLFQTGAFKKAIACFAEAIKLENRREEYYADLAKAYHVTGDYTLANYYFNKATETGPEEMTYWFHHILFLLDIDAIDAAADVLEEAEAQTYGSEILYIKAAIAFLRKDRCDGVSFLTEAIEEDLSCLPSFYALYPNYIEDEEIKALIDYFVKG